jgi:hypothetical protein
MEAMKKPWVYKRKNIRGYWVGWYENGRRGAKAFPTKSLAEHFRHIKYTQLNSDVFTSVVDFTWDQMAREYGRFQQVEGRKDASIYEVLLTLRHFERNTITTRNRKAGQAMPERPIPEAITTELANPVAGLPEGQEKLFPDRFSPKRWDRVREKVRFPGLTFQVLRKTSASLLAQRGVSTVVTQRLLEHSSPQLTNDIYTNVDPILRQAVERLPVSEWVGEAFSGV